jgi:nucleotide-binding universal stress UspA family protein
MPPRTLRFLVAVDFSPEAKLAYEAARDLALRTGASMTLAHVRPYSDVTAAVVEDRGDLLKRKASALASGLRTHYAERFASIARGTGRVRHLLLRGKPSFELRREARKGYDLLVIGSRGRGRVASALLGSTVQEILAGCPVPVAVTPRRRKR